MNKDIRTRLYLLQCLLTKVIQQSNEYLNSQRSIRQNKLCTKRTNSTLSPLRTYELSSGKLLNSFKSGSSEDSGMIVNVALDPSSTYLAAAGSDKCIFVHDLQSGDRLASLYGHSGKS